MAYFRRLIILLFFVSLPVSAGYLKEPISVKFATEASYYPFEYLENGKIVGFDIEIAKAVCNAAQLLCSFENQSFDSLLLGLEFGRFDAVIAAVDITKGRQEYVDFSDPYYKTSPVFLSKISAKHFSFKDKLIGVQAGSSNYDHLLNKAKESTFVIAYPAVSKAFVDLKDGRLDYVFADKEVVKAFLSEVDNRDAFTIKASDKHFIKGFSVGYGIAVKKENYRLLNRIDLGLKIIKKNGQYKKIYDVYFD